MVFLCFLRQSKQLFWKVGCFEDIFFIIGSIATVFCYKNLSFYAISGLIFPYICAIKKV